MSCCITSSTTLQGQDAGVRAYEGEIAEFYRHQGLADSWIERVLGRSASPGALGAENCFEKSCYRKDSVWIDDCSGRAIGTRW